ncbi:unnamed protein product [Acanthoscelides obtectus]|uniref:PiggyBac transposable element-derived protein domain-containing protein n=1 Tax=Acanthoscelides obtectus TaxID=200917 RepID=A0A9P0QCM4_ACAOB|nr:unnamed protein product [Acanthoscelides obtectus]CAK1624225.1 PiggyBac transposable element-derived protein 4 [Acanthoscelides obtectus]
MSYEKEQERLMKIWQELLSDEEEDPFPDLSDEYVPSHDESSSEDSDDDCSDRKRRRLLFNESQTPTSDSNAEVASTSAIDLEMETIEEVIRSYAEDSSEVGPSNNSTTDLAWYQVSGSHLKDFHFTISDPGIIPQIYESYSNKNPINFYELFLNDDILDMMVIETNRYAAQCKARESAPKARIHQWRDVEKAEMKRFIVYVGQDKTEGQASSQNVVLTLAENLLYEGRTIYTDNYYTSVSLAHELLEKKTHLVGTLRANRKLNPKEVTEKKLKKGETIAAESTSGVVVQKWMDKRDVLTLSTKHTSEMIKVKSGDKETEKPASVIDYNKHKAFIDLSDQMKAYNTCLRRGIKWYRKLAIELLTGTALVNAYILHQQVTNQKMSVTKFKEVVTTEFLNVGSLSKPNENIENMPYIQHILEDVGRAGRGRCSLCYETLARQLGRIHAQAKTQKNQIEMFTMYETLLFVMFF